MARLVSISLVSLGLFGLTLASSASCSSEEFSPQSGGGTSGDASVGATGGGAQGGSGGSQGGSGGSQGGSGGSQGGSGGSGGSQGGSGGAAGVGGSAGAAGSGGSGGCTSDTECDDGKACNGKETCSSGSCVPGTSVVCTNPDAAHCSVECTEVTGGSSCVVEGKDGDGDTHLDKACTASSVTADDCDDSNKNVYPGATEVCDGIDDDCNGKDELDEGASLYGGASDFVKGNFSAKDPALAWASANKQYGVVWSDDRSGVSRVYYARMSSAGDKLGASGSQEIQLSLPLNGSDSPRIAWGNGAFGVVWRDVQTSKIQFTRVMPDGTTPTGTKLVGDANSKGTHPEVVATASGWVVIWSDTRSNTWGSLYARALAADGTQSGAADTQVASASGSNQLPRATTDGTTIFVTFVHGASSLPNVVKSFKLNASLAISDEKSLSADPPASGTVFGPSAAAATSTGWALSWRQQGTSEVVQLAEQLANGTSGCSPTSLPTPSGGVPGGVAARGGSRIVAYGDGIALQASVKLIRFKSGCSVPITRTLAAGEIPTFEPRGAEVAWSDNGAAVVWTDWGTGKGVIRRWAGGPNLCDPPVP